jgi:hypothetical protein
MNNIAVVALLLAFSILAACGQSNQSFHYGTASIQTYYNTLEEITADSDLIVVAELTGKTENMNYDSANFHVTEAKVRTF